MHEIRLATPDDLAAAYEISLKTGHLGADASHQYIDPQMMGHIYSAPYLNFSPKLALVVEIKGEVLGFCGGAANTRSFASRLAADWWPELRQKYPKPNEEMRADWTADERRSWMIHEPEITPHHVVDSFPAHLHLNLLPAIQGQGFGSRIWQIWKEHAIRLGVSAVHVGANSQNARAVSFWGQQGFERIISKTEFPVSRTIWLGLKIA